MEPEGIDCLLITANCGSVFEDPSRLMESWISEFLSHIKAQRPRFVALHVQEVGGKTYEKSMEYVQEFIKTLCESADLAEYNKILVFLDEDYNSAEHFTALGNLYFVHDSISNIKIWNFLTHEFEVVDGKNIHTGNIESVAVKEKSKFPQQFFPECKWSRKGFLRTRWIVDGTTFDLVNIHLFHDASNLAACESYPSVYCKSRRRALLHTLERFHKDQQNALVPFFIFGDFNFRCDTEGVVKKLTIDLTEQRIPHLKNDHTKLQFKDADGALVLTLGKKEFTHVDHEIFRQDWFRQFDRELDPLRDILSEYPITFPPSYPFEEEPDLPHHYMPTRCPSWCDRIVMSKAAKKLIISEDDHITYGIIGADTCMGDHKPVFLSFRIKSNQGIVSCCDHIDGDCDKENLVISGIARHPKTCVKCLKQLNAITEKFSDSSLVPASLPLKPHLNLQSISPLVSISVVDADNLNVCMCNLLDDHSRHETIEGDKMCKICRNIIKQQPNERCTLVSKKVMLGDVVFSRIDSQYLSSTYSSIPSQLRKLQDPYTPESVESHSPQPEMEEKEFPIINDTTADSPDILENIREIYKHKLHSTEDEQRNGDVKESLDDEPIADLHTHFNMTHTVSPSQLTTRLEILRRESKLMLHDDGSKSGSDDTGTDIDGKKPLNESTCCFSCSCVIL